MAKKSSTYWKRRMESVADAQNKHADAYIEDLGKQYQRALQSIQRDIEQFYIRYANAEKVDMVTARKMLSQAEKEMWEVSLEEYRKMALDEEFIDQIESMYSKSRVSRLQAIQSQIQAQIEVLYKGLNDNLESLLTETFTDTYYQTIYEVQKGVGIATSFALFNEDAVKKVVSKPWKWGHFSSTVWGNKTLLLDELETALSQAFIRGDSMDKVIKAFDKRMKVGYSRAANIIQTEHAYIAGEATAKSYSETGVEEYEYLATLDTRTSKVCQSMDGRVFKVSERSVGLNYPPLHCRCRSTTVPYFEDMDTWLEERASRNPVTGKTKNVWADTKYPQWYEENVLGLEKVKQYEEDLDRWLKGKKASANKSEVPITKVFGRNIREIEGKPFEKKDLYKTDSDYADKRRVFDEKGKALYDLDMNQHNKPKHHAFAPHLHYWNGTKKDSKLCIPTKEEMIENKDVFIEMYGELFYNEYSKVYELSEDKKVEYLKKLTERSARDVQ